MRSAPALSRDRPAVLARSCRSAGRTARESAARRAARARRSRENRCAARRPAPMPRAPCDRANRQAPAPSAPNCASHSIRFACADKRRSVDRQSATPPPTFPVRRPVQRTPEFPARPRTTKPPQRSLANPPAVLPLPVPSFPDPLRLRCQETVGRAIAPG